MNNPTFQRIANYVRQSNMPEETKQALFLIFYKMTEEEQAQILTYIEKNKEALHLLAELVTELEQNEIDLNNSEAIESLIEKYLPKTQ